MASASQIPVASPDIAELLFHDVWTRLCLSALTIDFAILLLVSRCALSALFCLYSGSLCFVSPARFSFSSPSASCTSLLPPFFLWQHAAACSTLPPLLSAAPATPTTACEDSMAIPAPQPFALRTQQSQVQQRRVCQPLPRSAPD